MDNKHNILNLKLQRISPGSLGLYTTAKDQSEETKRSLSQLSFQSRNAARDKIVHTKAHINVDIGLCYQFKMTIIVMLCAWHLSVIYKN
jgi:hypothetical protein